ncbi:MAG: bifunctional proline dehydrogenase/L-glutamate gamma-semialdehyde dehydrogenase [Deltaproteobacteria bacterium]|nr:bifunctional proline dehydrogenase/L-glutamate gamma-semialdehyde dehydrogenase [Deltaproteobacteria bacterium]
MDHHPPEELITEAVSLAEAWQNRANQLLTHEEKIIYEHLKKLLDHPSDRVVMMKMIDQSFRSHNDHRVADQVDYIFRRHGVPHFFDTTEKLLLRLFLGIGRHFPHISVPTMVERVREDSSRSVIPGEKKVLKDYLQKRKSEKVRVNINQLGEAVLGEEEALFRLHAYLEALKDPEIEYISVKISTLFSQILPIAFDYTVDILQGRLGQLFRMAGENFFTRKDGLRIPKFVNLDMEEFRDLELTVEAFRRTLDREEFKGCSAGLALQAYLPESFELQQALTGWAKKRVAAGGRPIKIRLVKGANLEMERVEAALQNWPLAPYSSKGEVDGNYRRMMEYGFRPENIPAVHLGLASHNLFELAYGYQLARYYGVFPYFSFEMLEGMADHVRRVLQETGQELVLYAPVATREEFINAIAYLIRRLDENTSEENYLRYAPRLEVKSGEWEFLKDQFLTSFSYRDRCGSRSFRSQNRMKEDFSGGEGSHWGGAFKNEPDTDWSLAANRKWAGTIREKWKKKKGDLPLEIPLVIGGEEIFQARVRQDCFDPSQEYETILVAVCAQAGESDIHQAVAAAKADPDGWREKPFPERWRILSLAARELRASRGDLIGAAAANTGKVFTESDPEVSEAVDFTEYYPWSIKDLTSKISAIGRGKGVGLVISPWNFPISIPGGGIAALLSAGNTVIFKPASSAVLVGWILCQCFWRAGVSKKVLQFLPCSGSSTGAKLAAHPDIDALVFTGSTDTALSLLKQRPSLHLAAETGGKNATMVTAMSDRDQAIKNVLHSAFSNSGQKCSATSLLILEKEVYEDPKFKARLIDGARSLAVGSAWEFQNRIGPLIQPPGPVLSRALTRLEPEESWALKPEPGAGNPLLWTPGIKWGVRPGSYTHGTELFGPLLGVMGAENLEEAVELVNQTGYGLTSGLESLDQREQDLWQRKVKAGTLYINRGTTGAKVLRQPFGGWGKSALGAGIKVGGPNYAAQFMEFEEGDSPSSGAIEKNHALLRLMLEWEQKLDWGQLSEWGPDLRQTVRAVRSYLFQAENEFLREKDFFHLRGQDNRLRYIPLATVLVRIHPQDTLFEILARIAAAKIAGCSLIITLPVIRHSDEDLVRMIPQLSRIRYAAPQRVPEKVFEAAAGNGFFIAHSKVLTEGRLELLWYFREQSVCDSYHRYGNLGDRTAI